jgi:2,3-bisphosphoglycerate-dependent phosphoglycerate mutase
MKKLFTLFFVFMWVLVGAVAQDSPTVVYVVRHAEKITTDPNDNDPLLTEEGLKRAKKLSKKLKGIKLSAVYSTDFQRNKLTATPTANKQRLNIELYNTKNLKEWVAQVLQQNKGKNILIVGHSNTVLETIEALGGKKPIEKINDDDYNYFFEVVIGASPPVVVTVSKF